MTLIKAKKKSAEPEMSTKIRIGPPQKGAPSKPKSKKKPETLSPSPTLPPTKRKMYPKNAAAVPAPVPAPVIFRDPTETELVPRKVSEKEEDFETFVRRFKGTSRRKVIESDDEEEFEDDEDQDQEEDEEDYGEYYKVEGSKARYVPVRGNHRNDPSCDACIRRRKPCYPQASDKNRGACFECGKLKIKCIFSVSNPTIPILNCINLFSRFLDQTSFVNRPVRSQGMLPRNRFSNKRIDLKVNELSF